MLFYSSSYFNSVRFDFFILNSNAKIALHLFESNDRKRSNANEEATADAASTATRKRLHMCRNSGRRILSPIHTRSLTHSISVRSFTQLYNFSCFRRLFACLLLLLSFSSVMSLNITTHQIKSRHFERIKCSFGWRCPNESTQQEKPTNTRASERSITHSSSLFASNYLFAVVYAILI